LLYGASIIAWPFFWHIESSMMIVNSLYVDIQLNNAYLVAFMVISLSAVLWCLKPPDSEDVIEWPLLGFLALILSPFEYFALYFCCLHSTRHYKRFSRICLAQIQSIAYPLLALWMMSLMIFAILVIGIIYNGSEISSGLVSAIFLLLASLTVPHMWVINRASARQKA
jgi:Brp/Blh family beta-carotene 15,15'-monooxygenase